MKNLTLALGLLLSVGTTVLACETTKKGLGGGGPDGGASEGGARSGGSATGGTIGAGGTPAQGGSRVGGRSGSGGASGTGAVTATGGLVGGSGAGGLLSAGGVTSTGGDVSSGSGGARTGGAKAGGAGAGGARTGGTTSLGSGGARTGGSTGPSGSGTGGRGTGGIGTGGASVSTGGTQAGGVGGVGGTAGSGSGGSGLGGFGGHKSCQSDADCGGFKCCGNLCANPGNDILNCGECGTICPGPNPYCNGGKCGAPPCQGSTCAADTHCCGTQCCGEGQLCCSVTLGPSVLGCFDPVDGTCPTGCAACVCAAPSTPIATPQGERPIAELRIGDWVYSVDHGQIRAVRIKRVNRQRVSSAHTMVDLRLASGRALSISPLHPTADGRTFRDLDRGDQLDGVAIVEARTVGYDQAFTYDILPDSDTGTYFAASVLIGSTLATGAGPLIESTLK